MLLRGRVWYAVAFILLASVILFQQAHAQGEGEPSAEEPAPDAGLLMANMLCCSVCFIFYILMSFWVYKDAESRGMSGAMWGIIVFFLGILGLIIYLVVREPGMGGDRYRDYDRPRRTPRWKKKADKQLAYGQQQQYSHGPEYSQQQYGPDSHQQEPMQDFGMPPGGYDEPPRENYVEFDEHTVHFGPRSKYSHGDEVEFGSDDSGPDFEVTHPGRRPAGKRPQTVDWGEGGASFDDGSDGMEWSKPKKKKKRRPVQEEWPDEVDADVEGDFDRRGRPMDERPQLPPGPGAGGAIRKGKCPHCRAVLEVDMSRAKGPIVLKCPGCGKKSKWK